MVLPTRRFFHWIFWIAVFTSLLLVFLSSPRRDSAKIPIKCSSKPATASSYLILRSFDPGARRFRAGLIIPNILKTKEDKLEVHTVTPSQAPNAENLELALQLPPAPSCDNKDEPCVGVPPWNLDIPFISNPFWYPLESYTIDIRLDLKDDGKDKLLNLAVVNQIDQLVVDTCSTGYSFDVNSTDPNAFRIVLNRQPFIWYTAVILYVMAAGFLFYLRTTAESKELYVNSLGYLFALWTIRGIVVGPASLFPTIIDFCTFAAFVTVAAILVERRVFLRNRTG